MTIHVDPMHDLVLRERFEQLFIPEPNSGCWLWLGVLAEGYGQFWWGREGVRMIGAHCASWRIYVGPLGDGWALHHCDNPPCVNPEHLFLGDHADNMLDCSRKGRNTRLRGEGNGQSKLTDEAVRSIRVDLRSHRLIAADHGVNPSLISLVKSRKIWPHVDDSENSN